jgi:coenzyme F420 hydrogenase subunit beta
MQKEGEDNKMSSISFEKLKEDILSTGLCTACGTCVGVCPNDSLEFDLDKEQPVLTGKCNACGICYTTCPGADIPLPLLDRMLFSRERRVSDEPLGICAGWCKGYSIDAKIRKNAASGGCTTALLVYALEEDIIDGAIVVGTDPEYPWRPKPVLATTKSELLAAVQSKYALVPVNTLLKEAERKDLKKVAIVGLPCHIEGIRKMQMYGKAKNMINRISFTIGLFCGHNRSYRTTEHMIGSILKIPLDSIAKYEYRGGPESQDKVITFRDGRTKIIPREITSKPGATATWDRCKVCWDFSSELADISVGDIFLPINHIRFPKYTCIITRTKVGKTLIDGAEKSSYIRTSTLGKSGFSYNIGLETKKRMAARCIMHRKHENLPFPNYHYDVSHEPPVVNDVRSALLEQMKDIPEIVEWIDRSQRMKDIVAGVDPQVLACMRLFRSFGNR